MFDDAVKKLNLLEPEFVMSVGDLIQGYTENEASLDELPEGSKAASVIVPGGHIAEIALPTAYIEQRQGKPWQAFRLSIAVCDIDGEEDRGSQIWWKPFWRSEKNIFGSGTFVRE